MLKFSHVNVNVGRTPILKDISLEFEKGKITTIVGPNGCGKTTLLQTLNGLSDVTGGEIFLEDELYLKLPVRERARKLSFMPQFRDSVPGIPVKGFVEHGRFPHMGFSRKMSKEDIKAIEKALEFTKVTEHSSAMVNELSGGVRQRVYLALQLAQDSPYMVLDEPMTYLDFPAQREMTAMLNKLKEDGKTIILVLHDLNQALQISDNIVIMKNRKIVSTGTPKECIDSGDIEKVFECKVSQVEIEGKKHYIFS